MGHNGGEAWPHHVARFATWSAARKDGDLVKAMKDSTTQQEIDFTLRSVREFLDAITGPDSCVFL